MTFLHPALLWLIPLAAIPVLLHLLTLHRLKTVELSTYRFLFDSYVQQRRRMQFLEVLLAMLRALFLLVLVLVVCRPVLKKWDALFKTGSGREVILLVDCSASMNAHTGGASSFDRAKTAALAVAERLHPEDRATLVRVTTRPEEVFSRFTADTQTIRDKIEGLKTSPSRANLFATFTYLFGPEAPKRTTPVVYLFTDCQATGWREARSQGLDKLVPAETEFVVVNVASNEPMPNFAAVGDPPVGRAIAGLPLVLTPRVVNHSKEPADVTVSVLIDGKEVANQALTLKPGETATRRIIYTPTEPGVHRGRYEISTKATDRFREDDQFLFTMTVAPRVKVLLVNGNPSADPYESEALYLKAALSATEADPASGEMKPALPGAVSKEFVRSLDVQEIAEPAINEQALSDVSVVVLANCGTLQPAHFEALRKFVTAGGGLLVFPGDRVNADVYNTQFFPVPGPQGERLTAATLAAPQGDPEKAETFERFAVLDFAHPVLSVFDDPEGKYLRGVRFYRRFPLALPKPQGGQENKATDWPLASFANGAPALIESRFGEGRVILAAFPANSKWTNLPLKPEFVPLLLRLVSHVKHRAEVEAPNAVAPGAAAEVAVSGAWVGGPGKASGKVTDGAGRSTQLDFQRSATRYVAAFEGTAEPGYYTVEVRGDPAAPDKVVTTAFAVNLAPEESDFSALGEQQFRDLLPSAKVTFVDASAEAQQLQGVIGSEQEVWRPLIALMFVVIGVEFLLATLRGQRKDGDERGVGRRILDLAPGTWVGRMTGAGGPASE
jgi:hypothetical protein